MFPWGPGESWGWGPRSQRAHSTMAWDQGMPAGEHWGVCCRLLAWVTVATAVSIRASKSQISSMIQIQQVPSKVSQHPETSCCLLLPLALLKAYPCSWLQRFSLQRRLLCCHGGTGEQLLSPWDTSSAEPACQRCFSSRHNAGADPQAADPARGQEQARTLAGAGLLTGLPREGQEDALEPLGSEQAGSLGQDCWALHRRCLAPLRDGPRKGSWAATVNSGIDLCLRTVLTAPSSTSQDCLRA